MVGVDGKAGGVLNAGGKKGGIVHLIGAGPGDPGLITRLGHEILQQCDVVVFDDLIPLELIAELPPNIERYYVGKRSGRKSLSQPEINQTLLDLARAGKKVARLKGGDPLTFGRGGEEIELLQNEKIPVVVIPGVTAMSAVSAGLGFPLTDRRMASWLLAATGREADSSSSQVPWERLAELKGGTFAIYMGLGTLRSTTAALLRGGLPKSTPATVISNASTGLQRTVVAPLGKLANQVETARLETPALVIIGECVALRKKQARQIQMPLTGLRMLVTRPRIESARLCGLLRQQGAEPIPLPTIQIEPCGDEKGWREFARIHQQGGWLVFTSRSGVSLFIAQLLEQRLDLRALAGFKIAAIGAGTSQSLLESGLKTDLEPDLSTVESLGAALTYNGDLRGLSVIRIQGDRSDETIAKIANAAGASVVLLTVYRTTYAVWEPHWIRKVIESPPDFITFTSGSTVEGFISILGRKQALAVCDKSRIAVLGPSTRAIAVKSGIRVDVEARTATPEGLIEAIIADVKKTKRKGG